MKPCIYSHSRPIKDVAFNSTNEIIYTASNDRTVISWFVSNYTKISTFSHSAAVNSIKLTSDDKYLISGDSTSVIYVWDTKGVYTISKLENDPMFSIKNIDLNYNEEYLLVTYAGRFKGAKSFIDIYSLSELVEIVEPKNNTKLYGTDSIYSDGFLFNNNGTGSISGNGNSIFSLFTTKPPCNNLSSETYFPTKQFDCSESKFSKAIFTELNNCILVIKEDGTLSLINFKTGKAISESKIHDDVILNLDYSKQFKLVFTASQDGTACLVNFDTFEIILKLNPENPTRRLNTCRMVYSNEANCLIGVLAGGQDNRLVTTTNQKEGGFDILLYNLDNGSMINSIDLHFGPVNVVAISNDGKIIGSGSEDASVKLSLIEEKLKIT